MLVSSYFSQYLRFDLILHLIFSCHGFPTKRYRLLEKMRLDQEYSLDYEAADSVAILDFSLKFPQHANSAEDFWQMLVDGPSALTEVSPERFILS